MLDEDSSLPYSKEIEVGKEMPSTTLTSKGQMTLPKEIRDQLGLKAGDQLEVTIQDRHIVMVPRTLGINDVVSFLPSTHRLSIEEMDALIRKRVLEENP